MIVTVAVQKTMAANSLSLDALGKMLDASTVITHRLGNRRYYDWVFLVEGDAVLSMNKLEGKGVQKNAWNPTVKTR